MKNDPAVSVIVPVYQVEPYLEECLESLQAQTLSNIEIILVDDGSSDRGPEICDAFAARDERFQVIHQANAGLSVARNRGIERARAPWLMFVDSDDFVYPVFCEHALDMVTKAGADLAIFGFTQYMPDKGFYMDWDYSWYQEGSCDKKTVLDWLISGAPQDFAWNKIYRKELFRDIRYPEGAVWEDVGTTYRLIAQADKIWVSKEVLYAYRQRQDSICHEKTFRQVVEGFLLQMEKEYDFFREHYPELADKMEVKLTHLELDVCMYRCLEKNDEWFEAIRKRVPPRHTGVRRLGRKVWLKVQLLRIPWLFRLATKDRRRRMEQNDRMRLAWKEENGSRKDQ